MSDAPASNESSSRENVDADKAAGKIYFSDDVKANVVEKRVDVNLEEGHIRSAEEDFAAQKKQVSFIPLLQRLVPRNMCGETSVIQYLNMTSVSVSKS